MDKSSFLPLSGFRDISTPTKDWVAASLRQIFLSFGYQPLETPALEKQEILLGKLGDEGQKQLYLFEDNGGRKVGLRYDLTVPLARYVSGNLGQLPLPYKRFEIGTVWRAERAQKGRYRQFSQADVDIIGAKAGIASEKELLQILAAGQKAFGLTWLVLLNDRRLVADILDSIGVDKDRQPKLLQALDKKDKLTEAELETELRSVGLTDVELKQVSSIFLVAEGALERIKDIVSDQAVVDQVDELMKFGETLGLKIDFAPFMVRGLDYYTGTIFECVLPDFPSSLVAGGRYDTLVENLTGQKLPAVGISFGVDRIADYLDDQKLAPTPLFVVNLPEMESEVVHWVAELRAGGQNVELYLDSTVELGKQIKYADQRGYASIIIPLAEEWKKGQVVRKNLESGDQEAVEKAKIIHG